MESDKAETTMSDPLYRIDLEVADPDALIDEVDRAVRLGVLVPVEIDDETARNAYINARIAVAAKLITGTPMEPHDEAAFVLSMVRDAVLDVGGTRE
jgi:hypothetical protein